MFKFLEYRKEIKRLLDGARSQNARAWEAIDEGRCKDALDRWTSVVQNYAVARRLMASARPTREMIGEFGAITTAFNLTHTKMSRCLRDKE